MAAGDLIGNAMPLFYFNFWDHKAYVSDPKGIELRDLDAVRKRALDAAREIVDDGEAQGDDRTGWKFDIKDNSDRTVLTMPFSAAVPRRQA
jgi:hypothetical protein